MADFYLLDWTRLCQNQSRRTYTTHCRRILFKCPPQFFCFVPLIIFSIRNPEFIINLPQIPLVIRIIFAWFPTEFPKGLLQ